MWLNNHCCVCSSCKKEWTEENKTGCKDCRWMRILEKHIAYTPSILSGKHDIEVITCISKCPRFEPKDETYTNDNPCEQGRVCEQNEMKVCT
jgi:hypothetical protein